jgi:hypothetical protein
VANYSRITLAQIRTILTSRVGDNSVFWLQAEKDNAINHALNIWQLLVGEWTSSATIAGAGIIAVPSPIVVPLRVIHSNGVILSLTSIEELDKSFSNWRTGGIIASTMWAPIGINQFAVYPNGPVDTYTVEGLTESALLSASGDFIQLSDDEVQKLLAYAHHVLTWKEGGLEMQATASALEDLMKAAGERKADIMDTNFYRRYMGLQHDDREPPRTTGFRNT